VGFFVPGVLLPLEAKVARTSEVCHKSPRECESRSSSSTSGSSTQQGPAFLCCPYVADEQGRYRPTEGITQCPSANGVERCHLRKHDWRERKTGPCVPLRLMYCRSHGRHFTIYPMGHVPYSRRRVLPVDLASHPVRTSKGKKVSAAQLAAARWEGSWFRSGGRCCFGPAVATGANGRGPISRHLRRSAPMDQAVRPSSGFVQRSPATHIRSDQRGPGSSGARASSSSPAVYRRSGSSRTRRRRRVRAHEAHRGRSSLCALSRRRFSRRLLEPWLAF